MHETPRKRRLQELMSTPQVQLLFRHGKLGAITSAIGLAIGALVVIAHETSLPHMPEYVWAAILSVPVTILCMGLFSVLYEYYMRTSFANAMRSLYAAWDSGVTVFPTHSDAPDRKHVLREARQRMRLMSTTFSRYFTDVRELVEEKAKIGVRFQFIIYDPSSKAIEEKAREEDCKAEDFKGEIRSTCRRYLGPLYLRYPGQVQVKFCDFNTPFGITVVDDREMVLSLNIYGLARSKNETPCLVIENKYLPTSVFKLYENSFDTIWKNLDEHIPDELARFFTEGAQSAAGD
jgi:hypothetical protein